jgi:hypothetical protein
MLDKSGGVEVFQVCFSCPESASQGPKIVVQALTIYAIDEQNKRWARGQY